MTISRTSPQHASTPRSPEPARPIDNSYVVPGTRLVAGEYPGSKPDTPAAEADEKLAGFLDAGVTAFVDLTDPADGLAPYEPALRALAEHRGVRVAYDCATIRDMDVCDVAHMRRVLDLIDARLAEGHAVYVHCWGGVGRTGMVVGCWLVRHGRTGPAALAEVARLFGTMSPAKVRRHRSWGSPQTPAQRAMVEGWGTHDGARTRTPARRTPEPQSAAADPTPPAAPSWIYPNGDGSASPRWTFPQRPLRALVRGCLLGGAVGDALGWPVEFLSLRAIRERYGPAGIRDFDPASAGGRGAITDDTQMTLFTAEGVLRTTTRWLEYAYEPPTVWGGVHIPNPEVMWLAYQRWLLTQGRSGHTARYPEWHREGWLFAVPGLHAQRGPGNTCLAALAQGVQGTIDRPLNDRKGCGGVMRVAPIGLVPCEDPFAYAAMAAALTHGHPSGYLSAGAFAQIISDMLFGRCSLPEAVERALGRLAREAGHEETTAALRAALALAAEPGTPTAERVETLGGGWTGEEALAIGVYCALVATSFEHGVRLAVNHSGDSDSTGSIAGALLGVRRGEDEIPPDWREGLELRDVIAAVADDLFVGYGGGPAWRERYPGN